MWSYIYVYVACIWEIFFLFVKLCFSILPDFTQAVYGKLDSLKANPDVWWPTPMVIQYYQWWCEEVDVLLGANPLW